MADMLATEQTTGSLVFLPTTANRVCILTSLIGGPTVLLGMLLYLYVVGRPGTGIGLVAPAFGVIWALAVTFALSLTSARAELTPSQVTRTTALGTRTLRVSDITSARISSAGKGGLVLTVRTPSDRLAFTNSSFSNAQLREMRDYIRLRAAEIGRQIETATLPPSARQVQVAIALYLGVLVTTIVLIAVFGIAHQRTPRQVPRATGVLQHSQTFRAV